MLIEKLASDMSNYLTGMSAEKWLRYGALRLASSLLKVIGKFTYEALS